MAKFRRIIRQRTHPKISNQRSDFVRKFLHEASLHGLKHVVEKTSNCYEKTFWIFAILASVSLSLHLVFKMWLVFQSNPLILTLETTNEPIRNLNFPAVTICPSQQISRGKLRAMLDKLKHNLSITERELFEASHMELEFDESEHGFYVHPHVNLTTLDSYFRNASLSYKELIESVSPNCGDTILQCTWKSKTNCTPDLVRLLTPMGYCCTFNFPNTAALDPGGYRSLYKGKLFGLHLVLYPRNETSNFLTGHKVLVHDRDTYPYRPSLDLEVGSGEVLNVGVDPVYIKSDADTGTVPINKRDCYLRDEYQLTLNLTHSYRNCIMDCFSIYLIKECGCVRSYIQAYHPNATACGIQEMHCVRDVFYNVRENLVDMCHCRPPCEEIAFKTESTRHNLTYYELRAELNGQNPTYSRNHSVVRVFFKESRFVTLKRSLRYHWEDFIADVGGLLGVGVGFSFLSVVEIAYFFCYKFWKPVQRQDVHNASNSKKTRTKKPSKTTNQEYFNRQQFLHEIPL